jgi:dTDP-4-amino-4,6-dideoxygalactose transaminase
MTIPRRKPYFSSKTIIGVLKDLLTSADPNEDELLEQDLVKILNLPNPIVVGQGRIGLSLILKESCLKKGTEIIMPGYTFGTLTHIIKKSGFIPKAVDIDPNTYEMSVDAIKNAISKKTSAILATHLFGESCDILKIKKIATDRQIFLIEDCAQALGSTISGKLIGTFGDVAFSSFDISKPLQGIRGGVIFSKNKKLIERIRNRINKISEITKNPILEASRGLFGYIISQSPFWSIAMYLFGFKKLQRIFVKIYRDQEAKQIPYKLPNVYAKIVRGNLKSFKKRLIKRRFLREIYHRELGNMLRFQVVDSKSLGSVYMLLAKTNGDIFKLRRYLALRGIDIALADEIADNVMQKKNSNVTAVIKNSIALPIYEDLKESDIKSIATEIKSFLRLK